MDNNIQTYIHPHKAAIFNRFKLGEKSAEHTCTQSKENSAVACTKNSNKNFNVTAGNIAIISGIGLLFLSKGIQKNTGKYLNKFKEYLETKLEYSELNNNKKKVSFYDYSIRKLSAFISKTESINNITSLKDILFMKLMFNTAPTQRIHTWITKMFEQASRKTVIKSYKETQQAFDKMYKAFDRLDDYILSNSADEKVIYNEKTYTKAELVELAKGYRDTAKLVMDNFMSEEAQNMRYKYIKSKTSKLYSDFWDASFKGFWSKNNKFKRKEMWQSFIAAEQVKDDKAFFEENLANIRNVISYSTSDKNLLLRNYIKRLNEIVSPTDKENIDIINRLEWFAKNPEILNETKEIFLNEVIKLEKLADATIITEDNILKEQANSIKSYANLIYQLIKYNDTGEIQDMLSIYYKIAPFELSKSGAALAVKNAVKSFDKSVALEGSEFFDKLRDLVLGSAPTDVLTIVSSIGMIGYGLGFAHNKEERTSIILTSGIPIIGAIGTALYTTLKLVSGGKSLALGIVSGLVLNQMGVFADKIRLKYFNKDKQV
ncbi:MAG: hypothetical protein VZR09_04865 [Candidatus Gastranaerophilaceae bacterium]|nr:hypothetical protein [Candidatus Gastranaerophilaceae bacterium]